MGFAYRGFGRVTIRAWGVAARGSMKTTDGVGVGGGRVNVGLVSSEAGAAFGVGSLVDLVLGIVTSKLLRDEQK